MNDAVTLTLFVYGLAIVIAMAAAVMIKLVVGALALSDRFATRAMAPSAATASAPAPAIADDIPEHHLVAIAAAAHAVVGAHRLVHVGHVKSGPIWSTEGRVAQHNAHHPGPH